MRTDQYSLVLLVLACLSLLTIPVSSITFKVVPDVRKCLREEVHKDVLVVGDYQLSDVPGQRTDITVSIATFSTLLKLQGFGVF